MGAVETLKSSRVEKIDLLLAIDNSISMGDKQTLLGEAVPQLVDRLVNPRCVDPSKVDPVPTQEVPQPTSPTDLCPSIETNGAAVQTQREFEPVKDIHVGIISSSLGDLRGGNCGSTHGDDGALLLDRMKGGGTAPTFEGKHFLLWDPSGQYGPSTDVAGFQETLKDMVIGVGQTGCGYEMQLESIYRFLVDPAPYERLVPEPVAGLADKNVRFGLDQRILDQRADFLRTDSLVAIIMLSDENDCSAQAEGYGYFSFSNQLERGATICETDPNDACCYSCNGSPPAGCDADPICSAGTDAIYESPNLRCWDQKRRFGADLLYPIARYKNAFTLETIDPTRLDLVPADSEDETAIANPLLVDRPDGLVYFAGIVGVPWQAITRKNAEGQPDLSLGYLSRSELEDQGLFEALAGDPDRYVPPTDPFMVEAVEPRSGTSTALGATPKEANAINGGERTVANEPSELGLQYACIFDVVDVADGTDCEECRDGVCENPVCEGTLQTQAKAAPGLRQLALIREMGDQGIAASVCPAETDPTKSGSSEYGYNPAVGAIVDALKDDLRGQECLPFSLEAPDGVATCLVMQSSRAKECTCDAPGLFTPAADRETVIDLIELSEAYDSDESCFCEVAQLEDEALKTCQFEPTVPNGIDGWCYIDANPYAPVGNPDLIQCTSNERQIVRVVGDPQPETGATLHIFCTGER